MFSPIAYADVAPIVDPEGRFDDGFFAHVSQQLFQFDHSVLAHGLKRRIRVLREGGVVFVAPAAGFEADAGEFRDEGVVAENCDGSVGRSRSVLSKLTR